MLADAREAGGVRCAVVLLRRKGTRLRRHELSPAIAGDLELTDHAGASTFRRAIRVANLWADTSSGSRRSLLVPLWDPLIVRIGSDSLTLQGIELSSGRSC